MTAPQPASHPSPDRRSLHFFFNDPAPTEIYTLSLHDALPISRSAIAGEPISSGASRRRVPLAMKSRHGWEVDFIDRKSTRLNSSHQIISYAVFCLKKKKFYQITCPLMFVLSSAYLVYLVIPVA